eukprot:509873_1
MTALQDVVLQAYTAYVSENGCHPKNASQFTNFCKFHKPPFKGVKYSIAREICNNPPTIEIKPQINDIDSHHFKQDELKDSTEVPLHKLTTSALCNIIKHWIENYNKEKIIKMEKILNKHGMNGTRLWGLLSKDKIIIESTKKYMSTDMIQIMTSKTYDIVFEYAHEWVNNNAQTMKAKTIKQIAENLYNYPLTKFIKKIQTENIQGNQGIDTITNICKLATEWKDEHIEELKQMLLRYKIFTKTEFIDNMNKIFSRKEFVSIPDKVVNKIKSILINDEFDIEMIHYNIKENKNIDLFSDKVINMVAEMITENDSNMIQKIYLLIVQCFIMQNDNSWICSKCGNFNYCKFMNGAMNYDTSVCILCGISQIDSIISKVRNYDTFVTVTNSLNTNKPDITEETPTQIDKCRSVERRIAREKGISIKNNNERKENIFNNNIKQDIEDEIDKLIQNVVEKLKIDLVCIDRNDKKQCPCFLRLGKALIKYKRLLQNVFENTNGNDSINNTVQVNISKFVDNNSFQTMFIECVKFIKDKRFTTDNMNSVIKMLENNVDNIVDLQVFLATDRKAFLTKIKKHTNIQPAFITKIHKRILIALKTKTQKDEFGTFLSELNINQIDNDYHHILKSHIHCGNKNKIKNTFRYFQNIVHCEDTPTQIDKCRSVERRIDREKDISSRNNNERKENFCNNNNNNNNKNNINDNMKDIWSFQQYYNQSQLDIIHSYLVHSNAETIIQYHSNQSESDDEIIDKYVEPSITLQNRDKFTTAFGFGIRHNHTQLSPKYNSVYDELICNNLCSLSETTFYNMLT